MDNDDSNLVELTATINDSEEVILNLKKNDITPNRLYPKLMTAKNYARFRITEKICKTILSNSADTDTISIIVSAKVKAKTVVSESMEVKRNLSDDIDKDLRKLIEKIITELPFYIIQCDAFRAI